ncbi:MAG: hypothetical protein ABI045_03670 [Flavobacteriales bacterium]
MQTNRCADHSELQVVGEYHEEVLTEIFFTYEELKYIKKYTKYCKNTYL